VVVNQRIDQMATIHPFLDGNGRVGRLLITLLLCSHGVMRRPLLYLSLYFKRNREQYYDHLQHLRLTEPPVYSAISRLEQTGILNEGTEVG
jgi:Fic family protein